MTDKKGNAGTSSNATTAAITQNTTKKIDIPSRPADSGDSNNPRSNKPVGFQFDKPAVGEEIVVFTTSLGTIRLRLFPTEAPIAVTNFKTLVKSGYYDGIIFHRVIKDFMIQGGDPLGNGTGGESVWGSGFGVEKNANLLHFRGALSMAHSSLPNSNGSQFFIVQSKSTSGSGISAEADKLYQQYGGTSFLDGEYTVFGQAFLDDLKIVDAIAEVKTGANDKPLTAVVIKKAEVVKYTGK
ncbi:MAG: hypothetical protein BGN88_11880 [Clostridiales bacterium 43-6]|nr:MAG: hypothetical protein BGN88_11880 [Clostridiales bacterium 43-6]